MAHSRVENGTKFDGGSSTVSVGRIKQYVMKKMKKMMKKMMKMMKMKRMCDKEGTLLNQKSTKMGVLL